MNKLVLIIGPPAVGKYTVGKALSIKLGFKLLHEHQLLDVATALFDDDKNFITPFYLKLRDNAVEQYFQRRKTGAGIVLTQVHVFSLPPYNRYMKAYVEYLLKQEIQIFVIELYANYEVRLGRNSLPDRLLNKPGKQDIRRSLSTIENIETSGKANSDPIEVEYLFQGCQYWRFNSGTFTAEQIVEELKSLIEVNQSSD